MQILRTVLTTLLALAFLLGAGAIFASEAAKAGKALYERSGGVRAIAAGVDDFVNTLVQNPVVIGNPGVKAAAAPGRFTFPI